MGQQACACLPKVLCNEFLIILACLCSAVSALALDGKHIDLEIDNNMLYLIPRVAVQALLQALLV